VPRSGLGGAVLKDVTEVGVAFRTADFHPGHAVARILNPGYARTFDFPVETGPTTIGFEFGGMFEQGSIAHFAVICARAALRDEFAGERWFRTVSPQDTEFLGRQLADKVAVIWGGSHGSVRLISSSLSGMLSPSTAAVAAVLLPATFTASGLSLLALTFRAATVMVSPALAVLPTPSTATTASAAVASVAPTTAAAMSAATSAVGRGVRIVGRSFAELLRQALLPDFHADEFLDA